MASLASMVAGGSSGLRLIAGVFDSGSQAALLAQTRAAVHAAHAWNRQAILSADDQLRPLWRFEPIRGGGLKPDLHVRRDLGARATCAAFYALVGLDEVRVRAGTNRFGGASGPEFYPMATAEELQDLRG